MKIRAVLIQQELLKALKGKQGLPDTMSADEKKRHRLYTLRMKEGTSISDHHDEYDKDSTATRAAATAPSSDIDSDTTKLWHTHLGHMSERGMDVMSKQDLLRSNKIEITRFFASIVTSGSSADITSGYDKRCGGTDVALVVAVGHGHWWRKEHSSNVKKPTEDTRNFDDLTHEGLLRL
ncbi:hypothetical protein RJ639_010379 [Escallonia herrerae]|uniref:GAG-pre-integrase domain-containing protein n=1 Tax=Escallonia herrerae TaxID=1293975 RepID=A0AA88VNI3_9ASTE|nr:hypothetical protein RJ639_010379 [Escallonia herrerae]